MSSCAVVIPIYKRQLSEDEIYSVTKSLANLTGHDVYWIAPTSLEIGDYQKLFGLQKIERFDDAYFMDIAGYNRLLVSEQFYERFIDYDYMLICQPDAVVLKPELQAWIDKGYDYIGAPWPNGYSLTLQTRRIPLEGGIPCTAFVGNGGLSLRRISACMGLIKEFDDVSASWHFHGHAEDLFFSFAGALSLSFKMPNLMTAANFSFDIDPVYLHRLTGGKTPFGIHAWAKYDPDFCKQLMAEA